MGLGSGWWLIVPRWWVHDYAVYPLYAGGVHASHSRGFSMQSLDLGVACAFIENDMKTLTWPRSREASLHQLTEFGDSIGKPTVLLICGALPTDHQSLKLVGKAEQARASASVGALFALILCA